MLLNCLQNARLGNGKRCIFLPERVLGKPREKAAKIQGLAGEIVCVHITLHQYKSGPAFTCRAAFQFRSCRLLDHQFEHLALAVFGNDLDQVLAG